MRSAGVAALLLGTATYALAQATRGEPAGCAPAMVVTALRQLMGSLRFAPDSSNLELAGSGSSDLGTRALRISDREICRRAAVVYQRAAGEHAPPDSTRLGTAVARVGSYYFIYESHPTPQVLLTDFHWDVLAIVGFGQQ